MNMNPRVFGRVLGGLILLAIGGMFLLRQLGIVSFEFDIGYLIATFWPLILIAVGVQGMTQRGGWGWGLFLLGLGLFFQARNLGFIDLTLGEVIRYGWPVLLIYWGLVMIFRPGGKKKSENGWQSYPPKSDDPFPGADRPVPPPPPLHPNPLDLDYEPPKSGEPGAGGYPGGGAAPGADGRHEADGHQGQHGHYSASGHHGAHGWNGAEGPGGGWYDPGRGGGAKREHDCWSGWAHNPNAETRSGFIGDIHVGGDYWELRPMNISLFIGDTVLDLTKAQIPYGETRLNISSFIGDVKVFVPNDRDLGISVATSSFIGDTRVIDRQEGGFFKNVRFETPYYHEAERRVRLNISSFIGDVRIVKVG
jgi:lia operon protein LiaF